MVLVLLPSRLLADLLPPDDELQMDPKHVDAWQFNKVKKIVHRVGLLYKYFQNVT
jgi:hypothetical protein